MQRKTALVVSGIITAFVMVVVVGLVQMSGRASAAQPVSLTLPGGQATLSGAGDASTDVATLQAEVAAYRAQLQQAYDALQQAYNEIQVLSSADGFRGRGERGQRQQAPGLTLPFDQ
jgi:hypothetical protein